MREIKFRAWDQITKEMFEELSLRNTRICGFYDQGYEIMQFTGLKDKNGKEIYEGDIVKFKYDTDYRNENIFKNIAEVKIIAENYLKCEPFHSSELSYLGAEACEVIGNIYETPNLLTNKDEHKGDN